MNSQFDTVVIGAGHNGLTAAAFLAKRGRKVLVVERRQQVGGLAAAEEFAPGYRNAGVLHETAAVRRWVIEELGLSSHGLELRTREEPVLIPEPSAPGYLHWKSPEKAREEISRHAAGDAERYSDFRDFIGRLSPVLRKVFDGPLADLEELALGDLWNLGRKAVALRLLGKRDMMELFRIVPMCAADWLREWFESEIVSSALVGPALAHGVVGPWSPGTNLNLLISEALDSQPVVGGPAALVSALERAVTAAGVEIRTGSRVRRLEFQGDRVSGVTLEDGETIAARSVAASCDPKTLFLELVPPPFLEAEFEREVTLYRSRGTAAKVDLGLSGYPAFACRPELSPSRVRTGTDLNAIERSFDAVKYRRMSDVPMLDIFVPTIDTPELAPAGNHVASILVQWVPYELDGGWNAEAKQELLERTVRTLEKVAPEIRSLITAERVLSPLDLETEYAVAGGHLLHGEHAADQLVTRPFRGATGYASPFPGLFLCGSGSHPGGGITCAPGALAARRILGERH